MVLYIQTKHYKHTLHFQSSSRVLTSNIIVKLICTCGVIIHFTSSISFITVLSLNSKTCIRSIYKSIVNWKLKSWRLKSSNLSTEKYLVGDRRDRGIVEYSGTNSLPSIYNNTKLITNIQGRKPAEKIYLYEIFIHKNNRRFFQYLSVLQF